MTPAGEALYREVKEAFVHLDQGILGAVEIDQNAKNRLVIGYESATTCRILPEWIKSIRTTLPEVKLELLELAEHLVHEKIIEEEIDVGLIYIDKDFLNSDLLEKKKLGSERVVVAMSKKHPYANKKSISLNALLKENFVLHKKAEKPFFYDKFMDLCSQENFVPNVVQEVETEQALMSLVSKGMGVSVVFECLKETFYADTVFLPLKNPQLTVDYGLVRKKNRRDGVFQQLYELAKSLTQ